MIFLNLVFAPKTIVNNEVITGQMFHWSWSHQYVFNIYIRVFQTYNFVDD